MKITDEAKALSRFPIIMAWEHGHATQPYILVHVSETGYYFTDVEGAADYPPEEDVVLPTKGEAIQEVLDSDFAVYGFQSFEEVIEEFAEMYGLLEY